MILVIQNIERDKEIRKKTEFPLQKKKQFNIGVFDNEDSPD